MANKLNTLRDALDAAYPIPDTPHESVKQRARESRTAFIQGWQSCVASTALQAPVREVPEVIYQMRHRDAVTVWTDIDAYVYQTSLSDGLSERVRMVSPLPAAPVQPGESK